MSENESPAVGAMQSGGASAPVPAERPNSKTPPARPRRIWLFLVAAIVILILVAGVAVYVIHEKSRSAGAGTGMLLEPSGANYTISPGQYNAITFVAKSDGSVNGTIYEAGGLVIYLMTPGELEHLAIYGNISGYAWTSARLGSYAEFQLSIPVTPDSWDVVFVNPNTVVTELTSYLAYVTNIELVS